MNPGVPLIIPDTREYNVSPGGGTRAFWLAKHGRNPVDTVQHGLCRPFAVTVISPQLRVIPEVLLMRTAPVAAALLLSAFVGTAAAQTPFVPNFGKTNFY